MSQQPLPPEFSPWEPLQSPTPPPVKKRAGVITVILTLVVILSALVVVRESVLKIRHVAVVGNRQVPWDEVVRAAGLDEPVSFFGLSEEKIMNGINSHRYLVYQRMEKEFPDRVTLYVRERSIRATIEVSGRYYLIDEEGMVLEEAGKTYPEGQWITITGLHPKSNQRGSVLTSSRLADYTLLMNEIEMQGFSAQVSELNLDDPDNLILITADGYTVRLGNSQDLRAKIGTVRGVIDKLNEMVLNGELARKGGVILAMTPGEAIYDPN